MTKNIRILLAGFLLLLAAACTKDDAGVSGPPVIHRVTMLDSAKMDSAFVEAFPGTLILITGENLKGATSVKFNNFESYFNPAYNTNTHIIMTIPRDATTEATDPDVPNQIRITTPRGEAVHGFTLNIPPPSISGIENENAFAGDSMIVHGAALWLVEKVILPGGREITETKGNFAGDRLAFLLPDLQGDTGRITIVGKIGTAYSDGPINNHQETNVISNFTNSGEAGEQPRFNWPYWGAIRTNDPVKFPGTRGFYLEHIFGDIPHGNWNWWESNRTGQFNTVVLFTPEERNNKTEQYALKFEINTKEPWTAGVCLFRFNNLVIRWKPWDGLPGSVFHTGNKWRTVTIPLDNIRKSGPEGDGTGDVVTSMADIVLEDGGLPFVYWLGPSDDKPITFFHAAFDNFRIVKIK
ncbi:glycan-binding surface protein [Chitinophaga sp.]|uniref:glycan-binding surface protein n=1 Tax=Chitinophaga sp. TaxID=1869181 RepID=UPI002616FA40|nr:glycan-binding surface protein [uncultured Chitinophaga sp.]